MTVLTAAPALRVDLAGRCTRRRPSTGSGSKYASARPTCLRGRRRNHGDVFPQVASGVRPFAAQGRVGSSSSNDPLNYTDPLGLCRTTDVTFNPDGEVVAGPSGGLGVEECGEQASVLCGPALAPYLLGTTTCGPAPPSGQGLCSPEYLEWYQQGGFQVAMALGLPSCGLVVGNPVASWYCRGMTASPFDYSICGPPVFGEEIVGDTFGDEGFMACVGTVMFLSVPGGMFSGSAAVGGAAALGTKKLFVTVTNVTMKGSTKQMTIRSFEPLEVGCARAAASWIEDNYGD